MKFLKKQLYNFSHRLYRVCVDFAVCTHRNSLSNALSNFILNGHYKDMKTIQHSFPPFWKSKDGKRKYQRMY